MDSLKNLASGESPIYANNMIWITPDIVINENEIKLDFIRSSGPGGQNVNKVATGVQLRFDLFNSSAIKEDVRDRLLKLAHGYITENGELIIEAQRFRTQQANRQDAINRLINLIRRASEKPKIRLKTKPTKASQEKRLEIKRKRSNVKRLRSRVREDSGD